jgi:hypothetical protein
MRLCTRSAQPTILSAGLPPQVIGEEMEEEAVEVEEV